MLGSGLECYLRDDQIYFQNLAFSGYIVDCPHYERMGYGGDGNASCKSFQTLYEGSSVYMNWMQMWQDCIREDGGMPHCVPNPYPAGGGPYWCGFIITGSWQIYLNYGDSRLIEAILFRLCDIGCVMWMRIRSMGC